MPYIITIIIFSIYLFYSYNNVVIIISNLNVTRSHRNIKIHNKCIDHCNVLISLLKNEKIGIEHICYNINDCFNILLRYFVSSKISKRDIVTLDLDQYFFVHNTREIFFITKKETEYRINHVFI